MTVKIPQSHRLIEFIELSTTPSPTTQPYYQLSTLLISQDILCQPEINLPLFASYCLFLKVEAQGALYLVGVSLRLETHSSYARFCAKAFPMHGLISPSQLSCGMDTPTDPISWMRKQKHRKESQCGCHHRE